MNRTQAAPFEALLRARRAGLLEQLANLRGGQVGRAEASADHFDRPEDSTAQVNTARDLEFALDAHETAELALVEAALHRIETDGYGLCGDCGREIPPARLRATPEAWRCIDCQTKLEKKERSGLLS